MAFIEQFFCFDPPMQGNIDGEVPLIHNQKSPPPTVTHTKQCYMKNIHKPTCIQLPY